MQHPDDPQLAALGRIEQAVCRIERGLAEAAKPAQIHPITFDGSAGTYRRRSEHPPAAKSVGIVNPTELAVYVGLAGERAEPNSRAFTVPPQSAVVIPVSAERLELGVDKASLGTETATIFLLRFEGVQPLFLGKGY